MLALRTSIIVLLVCILLASCGEGASTSNPKGDPEENNTGAVTTNEDDGNAINPTDDSGSAGISGEEVDLLVNQWSDGQELIYSDEININFFAPHSIASNKSGEIVVLWYSQIESDPVTTYYANASMYNPKSGWSTDYSIFKQFVSYEYSRAVMGEDGSPSFLLQLNKNLREQEIDEVWVSDFIKGSGWKTPQWLSNETLLLGSYADNKEDKVAFLTNTSNEPFPRFRISIYDPVQMEWSDEIGVPDIGAMIRSGMDLDRSQNILFDNQGKLLYFNWNNGLYYYTYDMKTGWSDPRLLYEPELNPDGRTTIAHIDEKNNIVLVWRESKSEFLVDKREYFHTEYLKSMYYTEDEGWSSSETLESLSFGEDLGSQGLLAEIAANKKGDIALLYKNLVDDTLQIRMFEPISKAWGSKYQVGSNIGYEHNIHASMDDFGNVLVVWSANQIRTDPWLSWSRFYEVDKGWRNPVLLNQSINTKKTVLTNDGYGYWLGSWANGLRFKEIDLALETAQR